jgi:peptidoglycan/LPS O-acetylase OafA/YrhL
MTDWSPPRTPKGQISRVPQMPGLDGMRALAVVAVMIYHANNTWLHGGFLGVEVFFVISGYLITLLLISEHERSGRVDLKQFWMRRFRRLLPALFVMLGLLTIYVAVGFADARGRTRGDILGGLSYGSNWYQIWVGAGYTAREAFAPLRHLWSLAVEEQFYLLWPLIMVLILRRGRQRLPRVALWLWGIVWLLTLAVALLYVPGDIDSACSPQQMHGYFRFAGRCVSINDALYLGTFSRAGGLLLGAALAIVWRPTAILRSPLRRRGHLVDVIGLIGLGGLGWMMWHTHLADPALTILTGSRFDPWLFRGGLLITGVSTVFVIMAVTHAGAFMGRVLGNPLFSWIGTRSYGMYLYHWPIYQIIRREAGEGLEPWEFALAMLITLPLTELSFRFVEMPIRQGRVGAWLRSQHRRASAAVLRRRRILASTGLVSVMLLGFAGVSIAMAPNRCIGAVECASEAGEELIAAQPSDDPQVPIGATTTTSAPAPTTTIDLPPGQVDANGHAIPEGGAPAPTAPPTVPPTTEPPPPPAPVAVGESVMLGAVPQLQAGGFNVNAAVSRNGEGVADVVGQMRAAGQIGDVVVIQAGTNGPVAFETYQRIMSFLPADSVPHVWFLTVSAPKGWIAGNNELIRALPTQYPNVQVVDWEATAPTLPLCGDDVHVSCGGGAAQAYANLIFTALGRTDLVR